VTRVPAKAELVASGLSFPTTVEFDDAGELYVAEAGLGFGGGPRDGRVWHLDRAGGRRLVADGLRGPVNGLTFHDGGFYVSEGGYPARISRLDRDGILSTVLDGFPGPGNYHVDMVAVGPDGRLYFDHGAMTNTGVVGPDGLAVAWLQQLQHAHDVPGFDLLSTGWNATTPDPRDDEVEVSTGAFSPFGVPTSEGQLLPAGLPATASVVRCEADGTGLALVAWGLRNPFGLRFLPDGRLVALDQGADDRGSRPVAEAPGLLFEIEEGGWYGWPDFVGAEPVTARRFQPERGPAPAFLIANRSSRRHSIRWSRSTRTSPRCVSTSCPPGGGTPASCW
jgi:glucose/arabinose dehydrogenase